MSVGEAYYCDTGWYNRRFEIFLNIRYIPSEAKLFSNAMKEFCLGSEIF